MTTAAGRKRLIPYPEQRVLEDVAQVHGFTPTRIFAIMLPIWRVEVRATTTEGRPYELIDRYLERAIAEAQVRTVPELSRFLSLDQPLVDRAIRVLATIGHVTFRGAAIELTELGWRSVQDGVCYLMTVQDRRKMYFDAYRSRPLSRKYYDPGLVTLLPPEEVTSAGDRGTSFRMLHSTYGFRKEALAELAGNPDREHYNLPARIESPESLGEDLVYLPMYVVRAMDAGGRLTYLAYTQAADSADPDLSELLRGAPEIAAPLDAEFRATDPDRQENRIKRWLEKHNMAHCRAVRTTDGTWRVVLPEAAFVPVGTIGLNKVGSYVVLDQDLLHVSCEVRTVRERALLERVDAYVVARRTTKSHDVRAHIARVAAQLGLSSLGLKELQRMAALSGMPGLARELATIADVEDQ